jgi:hypothetical protein
MAIGREVDASQLSNRLVALGKFERALSAVCRILGGLLGGAFSSEEVCRFGLLRRVERKSWKVYIFLSVFLAVSHGGRKKGSRRGTRTEGTEDRRFLGGAWAR